MKTIEFNDKEFPEKLRKIHNPPKELWVKGNIEILKDNAIAVIGSRNNTDYGKYWCEKFVKELLKYNLVIVSGMAVGIDSIAHNTALKYGGKTIAVLPSGFENVFPKENIKLFEKIIESGGLVVSEYSPKEKHSQKNFLERNRIVSGLGFATLVIEAAFRSGTSVTANITIEEGKKVFCVPGSLNNPKSLGTNIMIKKGANLVTSVEDIVKNYNFLHKTNYLRKNSKFDLDCVDEEYRDVYSVISDFPIDVNLIAKKANISIEEALYKISMLEIDGKLRRVAGNKFEKE